MWLEKNGVVLLYLCIAFDLLIDQCSSYPNLTTPFSIMGNRKVMIAPLNLIGSFQVVV